MKQFRSSFRTYRRSSNRLRKVKEKESWRHWRQVQWKKEGWRRKRAQARIPEPDDGWATQDAGAAQSRSTVCVILCTLLLNQNWQGTLDLWTFPVLCSWG